MKIDNGWEMDLWDDFFNEMKTEGIKPNPNFNTSDKYFYFNYQSGYYESTSNKDIFTDKVKNDL